MDDGSYGCQILSFKLVDPRVDGVIDQKHRTITLTLPEGTDRSYLTPIITVSDGAKVTPRSAVAQDFTHPITYWVVSENGVNTFDYLVVAAVGDKPIKILEVPPKGQEGSAVGMVFGVSPTDYQVAVLIRVHSGWWTKPTFASPLTPIWMNGFWETDITTGGADSEASEIRAYLIPKTASVPTVGGGSIPAEYSQFAYDRVKR
jgi:hypothetical protein